jgi:hypothetical protein
MAVLVVLVVLLLLLLRCVLCAGMVNTTYCTIQISYFTSHV